ncbi:MAG: bifunctional diaminohydroxyphosphoribosylaminopyrimidine deaminase/5-amino-6-(5-phosphoribosylamino)uracil reductase RibD, partial [Rhodanobacteraceae bacterium]
TPPCVDALLAAGVARVALACQDPYPGVAGRGIAMLRAAGVVVDIGLLHDRARELNRGFFSRIERNRPWVRLKLATSLDGRSALANGESKWITGAAARADVQRWRARSSALLTGSGTARADNPHLTVRLTDHIFVAPLRVLLDTRLDALPANANLLDATAPTLIFHAGGARPAHAGYAKVECADTALCNNRIDLIAAMQALAARGINELQVEGGPALCGALFEANLVDELLWYVAPALLGDAARPAMTLPSVTEMTERRGLTVIDRRQVGADLRLLLRPGT